MARYRIRPVEVEAVRFTGNWPEIADFAAQEALGSRSIHTDTASNSLYIDTLEGRKRCASGDWVIRGVQGELYPCRNDIFEETYEAVEVASVLEEL